MKKKVLVIGGTSGFGGAVAELLSKDHEVIRVGRSKNADYQCDLSDLNQWNSILSKIKSDHARIDSVFCIHGLANPKKFEDFTINDWESHLTQNLIYVTSAFRELLPLLNHSKFITVGSQWNFRRGCPVLAPYIAAKYALHSFSEEMALAYQEHIFAHYIVPTMNTPRYHEIRKSFRELNINPLKEPEDFKSIAKSLVNHAINLKESGTYDLNKI